MSKEFDEFISSIPEQNDVNKLLEILESFINDEDNHTEGELGNSCIDVKTLLHFIKSLKQPK